MQSEDKFSFVLMMKRATIDADTQALIRLLESQGVTIAQARTALEKIEAHGVSLVDLVDLYLTSEDFV